MGEGGMGQVGVLQVPASRSNLSKGRTELS